MTAKHTVLNVMSTNIAGLQSMKMEQVHAHVLKRRKTFFRFIVLVHLIKLFLGSFQASLVHEIHMTIHWINCYSVKNEIIQWMYIYPQT